MRFKVMALLNEVDHVGIMYHCILFTLLICKYAIEKQMFYLLSCSSIFSSPYIYTIIFKAQLSELC